MEYKTIVGLEIHVQLQTKSKAFCHCKNDYGSEPNKNVCPICLGLPGALPYLNEKAVEYAVKTGLSLNCDIQPKSSFDRKNYFYPDLTKGYQITQNFHPICKKGYIIIEDKDNNKKSISLQRIHLEEDTGKSNHKNEETTLMDYNRCGVPLIEIVTNPDINSGFEARMFLEKLRQTLLHIGVSDCKMEEGSMRCDVNVNIVSKDGKKKSAITEIKNLNSFRAVEKAIEFEEKRQSLMLENGEEELKTTRRWDDAKGETILMRVKYTAEDYRFAPEGDLPDLILDKAYIDKIRSDMPESLDERIIRLQREYKISEYESKIFAYDDDLNQYFEKLCKLFDNSNLVSNWIINELLRRINDDEDDINNLKFSLEDFANLLKLLSEEKINNNTAKKVFRKMYEEGIEPKSYIEENNLIQINDDSFVLKLIDDVLKENEQSVIDYKNGKDRALGYLMGQIMKKSRGKANPAKVNEILVEKLQK
ncbi:MAG: Asp-tRNA(Asn)/Glu-tRNA(Gln) amidotransferase subunit GatB [Tissierellia bacterium]|nr:Asp-tRNA(Asn)/Glu-tRNA(Gln) amidotransferase subunit GatB [Tissierellia bacterium]